MVKEREEKVRGREPQEGRMLSVEAQPQTSTTNPASAVETALAAMRTGHFGREGPEVKESPFLSPGQACWWLSSGGGCGLGPRVVDK